MSKSITGWTVTFVIEPPTPEPTWEAGLDLDSDFAERVYEEVMDNYLVLKEEELDEWIKKLQRIKRQIQVRRKEYNETTLSD